MENTKIKIKTPDQKLRVFVSSTLKELADERLAARSAIESIRLIPVLFELGARPHPPKKLYQAYLDQSHIFIGIYWQSYGWIAENEKISGLEDELLLSEKFPRLIYVKEPAPLRDEKLNQMLDFIRSAGNVSYKSFSSPAELKNLIEEDLVILISERFYLYSEEDENIKKTVHNNLPVNIPRIIGREKEILQISELISEKKSYIVTITGPGGIGKTRLAIAAAGNLEKNFPDGIYFIDLSGIFEEKNFGYEFAKIFGISIRTTDDIVSQITEFISDRKILLILDNFEQLSHAGYLISEIITRCPGLSVIVTSRNPLELSTETEYNIESLSFPDVSFEISEIKKSPAVILFSERAKSVDKNFELSEENILTVSEICRMLGGIPLAIELAAVKVRMFPLREIKERLSERLDLLTGGRKDAPARHKTMKAALEWSYELINDDEKKLFRRLSVFINGFDFEAIENICCFDMDDSVTVIESLLSKNFFRKEKEINGVNRFSMLMLIQKYSEELLEKSGEKENLKTILADYYLKKLRHECAKLYGTVETRVTSVWKTDIKNVMNALEVYYSQKKFTVLIEMIYSLWPIFWIFDNENILEKKIDLQKVLDYDGELTDELTGKLSWLAGSDSMEKGDFKNAMNKFMTAEIYFKKSNNIRGVAWTNLLINSLKEDPENSDAEDDKLNSFIVSSKLFNESKDLWGESVAMQYIAAFEMERGNYLKAIEYYDLIIRILKEMESDSLEGYMISMKALAYMELKEYEKSHELLKTATEIQIKIKIDEGVAYCLKVITYYFFKINDTYTAMFTAGMCSNIFSKFNFVPWHMLSGMFEYIDKKILILNEGELSEVFNKGMNMNIFRTSEKAFEIFHNAEWKIN